MSVTQRLVAGFLVMASAGAVGHAQQLPPSAADRAALSQFAEAVAKYVALRESLTAEKLSGPTPNSSPGELTRASDVLAAAIQRARPKARPGDVFVAPVAPVLKQRVVTLVRNEKLGPVLAKIDDDETPIKAPTIHQRFPDAAPMATMPASLLAVLPALPKALEYRIIGQYLVLRDVEAALIIDFIPAAIPR